MMPASKASLVKDLKEFLRGYESDEPSGTRPWFLGLRSSRGFIITTVILGIYVDIFLYASTVVTIPFLVEDQLGVDKDSVLELTGWSMVAYSVASLIVSPVAGILADTSKGRRLPLLMGLAFLLAGIVCLWEASSTHVLLLGRVLQGASAGFIWTIGLALIVDTVGQGEIGQVLAYADISLCFGLATAPPVAGSVLKALGKDAVYALIMGLTLIDVFMRVFLVETRFARKWMPNLEAEPEKKDVPNEAPSNNELSNVETLCSERERGRIPPIRVYIKTVFRSWRILGALLGTWASAHILITMDIAVPIYMEETFKWDSSKVGLMLLAFYGPSLFCILSGRLADHHGGKWLAITGFLGSVPAFLGLTSVEAFESFAVPAFMWILMACAGVALAIANTPVMAEIVFSILNKQEQNQWLRHYSGGYGLAYGSFMTLFSLGSLTASLATPVILERHGWAALMYSLAACCIFGTISMALWAGEKGPMGRWSMGKTKPRDGDVVHGTAAA